MSTRFALATWVLSLTSTVTSADLFDAQAPTRKWAEFKAAGFERPVSGIIFTDQDKICAGMPLGGVGTGCLDIETSGVMGFSSVFFPSVMVEPTPYQTLRNAQLLTPFLGLSVGDTTWVLASQELLDGGNFRGCIDPVDPGKYTENEAYMAHWRVKVPKTEGVRPAHGIRYWGHYPVVDIDYQTDAPVAVSLRGWAPFLPGDAKASSIPGAIFEVHLENTSTEPQKGVLAFNFPGPHPNESGSKTYLRSEVKDKNLRAIVVEAERAKYALAVLDEANVRFGGNLSVGGTAWSKIAEQLPATNEKEAGASAAVAFDLQPGEKKQVRFVLVWYITHWLGGAYDEIKHFDETWVKNEFTLGRYKREERSKYYPDFTRRYSGPLDVARELAERHAELLRRIVAWQQVIYSEQSLPVWLRAALVCNLSQFAEDSLWAAPEDDIAKWSAPLGAFQLTECPRTCSIVGCIASNFYGDLPVAYFFPDLERQILRGYVAYMRPDGAIPFLYPPMDFTKAAYEWQIGLNGACFADLVHRLWLRTEDDSVVKEFYSAVKKNTEFTVHLASGPQGIISFHREGVGQEWWEHTPVFGMVTHLAGVRMAQLRFAQRMAEKMGDDQFARRCADWIAEASKLTEEHLWNKETQSYDFFNYPAGGKHSADIMSSQLDGQWMVDLQGLEPVFRRDRIKTALDTIQRTCFVERGLAGFAEPGKGPDLARYGTFPPEVNIVAMTYMYHGNRDLGLEIARRNMDNIIRVQGLGWDMPNLIRCDTGARTYGADYYQNMVLWGLPAAMAGENLTGPCRSGGLVTRIIEAASGKREK
ncbi:MAG: GH116 family glycosyl-hydrolase [Pirellulales bacterium]